MVELAGLESSDTAAGVPAGDRDDASSVTGSGLESGESSARGAQAPAPSMVVSAALGELLVVVSGRTADTWWPALDVRGKPGPHAVLNCMTGCAEGLA